MARLQLKNVNKRWGNFVGVENFDLDIADEEFLVLLGPSGCGKSTTMRMIAGLESVTEGEIVLGDRVVNSLPPKDRDISMVFQSYGLYPNLSVYENIRFPLRVRKVPKEQHHDMVATAIRMVELEQFQDRRPAELSGGQRQRVALGRAIVRKPTVFLMDEPLSNLDAKLRVSTRAQIKNLQSKLKTTTVYVTHDQIEAMTLADRVVVMSAGRIQQVGTPTDIYNTPQNTFVASFIGSPAMNLIEGHLSGGVFQGEGMRVEGLGGRGRPRDPGLPGRGCRDRGGRRRHPRGHVLHRAPRRGVDDHLAARRRARLGQDEQGLSRRNRRDGRGTGARLDLPSLRRRHGRTDRPLRCPPPERPVGSPNGKPRTTPG